MAKTEKHLKHSSTYKCHPYNDRLKYIEIKYISMVVAAGTEKLLMIHGMMGEENTGEFGEKTCQRLQRLQVVLEVELTGGQPP